MKNKLRLTVLTLSAICWLATGNATATEKYHKKDRQAVLELVKRQRALFQARIKGDWKEIYSFFTPDIRQRMPLWRYILVPYLPPTPEEKNPKPSEEEFQQMLSKPYEPPQIGYHISEVRLTRDRHFAAIALEAMIGLPVFMAPVTASVSETEYWRKIGNTWYLEWDLKYMEQMSGTKQKLLAALPEFTRSVKIEELADWYLEMASRFPEGSIRSKLYEDALELAPLHTTIEIVQNGFPAEKEVSSAIDRAMQGRKLNSGYYRPSLELGYWYGVAGELREAYDGYQRAYGANSSSGEALDAMVLLALMMDDFPRATSDYLELLRMISYTHKEPSPYYEHKLENGCQPCDKLDIGLQRSLFRSLVDDGRYTPAANLLRFLSGAKRQFASAMDRLTSWGGASAENILGKEWNEEYERLTLHDLVQLAEQFGVTVEHTGDLSERLQKALEHREQIRVVSSARQNVTEIGAGYSTDYISSEAEISAPLHVNHRSNVIGGYIALLADEKSVTTKFYQDDTEDQAGTASLLTELEKLETGGTALLARASLAPVYLQPALKAYFKKEGLNPAEPVRSQIILFERGKNNGRIWESRGRLVKQLLPAVSEADTQKGTGRLVITKKGKESSAKFSRHR